MRCSECNSKFTFTNIIKSMNRSNGKYNVLIAKVHLKKKKNRFIVTISVISVFFADIISRWLVNVIDSRTTSLFIGGFIGLIVALTLLLISQNWCKYIRINKISIIFILH